MEGGGESSWAAMLRPRPLPRARAIATLVFAAAAALSAGGMLEYASGSPAAQGQGVAAYWARFFAFNFAAFGGAALIGGLPGLARRSVKWAWLIACAALCAAAFEVWYRHFPGDGALAAWASRWRTFVPAALALLAGVLWRELPPEAGPRADAG